MEPLLTREWALFQKKIDDNALSLLSPYEFENSPTHLPSILAIVSGNPPNYFEKVPPS